MSGTPEPASPGVIRGRGRRVFPGGMPGGRPSSCHCLPPLGLVPASHEGDYCAVRIAIVGTGVSGLMAAYLLHLRHDVIVYEADGHIGGHINTIRVDTEQGSYAVDTGFIVFNQARYPRFTRLLRHLGVATRPTCMSFGVHAEDGRFEYSSRLPVGLLARPSQLAQPAFQRMLADWLRFRSRARRYLERTAPSETTSMADFVASQRLSTAFVDRLLVPLGASIWSADRHRFLGFPARYVLAFFDNHGLVGGRRPRWRTVIGGSYRYVDALVAPFREKIRLNTPVVGITRHPDHVEVRSRGGQVERVDRVVIATHSDQALRLLDDASDHERAVLEAFPYQDNDVVLHTDERMLPRRRAAWASWNYHLPEDVDRPTGVTYHMNRLQGLRADRQFCVTLNRAHDIDPEKVMARLRYSHPIYTADSVRKQRLHATVNGVNRTHFCGAYWGHGFHEDGIESALRVVESLGVDVREWSPHGQ